MIPRIASVHCRLERRALSAALLAALCTVAVACAPLPLTRPVAKIGLIASFEGPKRALGYDAIFAARLALREANAAGGAAGWALELVALDDSGSLPLALRQVRALSADPEIAAAVHLVPLPVATELTEAYRDAGIPVEFFGSDTGTELPDSDFSSRYVAVSQGIAPTSLSIRAYHSVQSAIQQIAERVRSSGRPGRMP